MYCQIKPLYHLLEKKSHFDNSAPSKEVQSTAVLSRAEYIQKLRSLYQQRHRQRQGVYPLDDTEEHYEKQIQELELTVSNCLDYIKHFKHDR